MITHFLVNRQINTNNVKQKRIGIGIRRNEQKVSKK